jgi:hypothetical protein
MDLGKPNKTERGPHFLQSEWSRSHFSTQVLINAYRTSAFGQKGLVGVFTSASPRCFDDGDVDLLHRHHRLEGTLCLTATSRKRIG